MDVVLVDVVLASAQDSWSCSVWRCWEEGKVEEEEEEKKSIGSVSINLRSGGLIAVLNWVNRIVYLKGMIP